MDTIWNHPDNAGLRKARSNRNALFPGDVVVIPDRRDRQQDCATGKRHRFRLASVPILFQIQLFDVYQKPLANKPYVLTLEDRTLEGTTDGHGGLKRYIPNHSRSGRLRVGDGELDMPVEFGQMDPIETTAGIFKRLLNMGYGSGDPASITEDAPAFRVALRQFQLFAGLPVTGSLDDKTRDKIRQYHDEPGDFSQRADQALQSLKSRVQWSVEE